MSKLFFCSNFKYLNFSINVLLKAYIAPWLVGLYAAPLTNLIFWVLQNNLVIFAGNSPPLSVWMIEGFPIVLIKSFILSKTNSADLFSIK